MKIHNHPLSFILSFSISSLILITVGVGCESQIQPTPYDRNDYTPIAGPPTFPMIFDGKFTVDGKPGPSEQTIYAEFIHGGSPLSRTLEGEYIQVILSPVSVDDLEHGEISFYLGTRDGDHVKAKETWQWDTTNKPINQTLNLTFPRLPKN
ncbi:MAG: hypothetical protein CL791_03070 [Chloroflexi bacterium]|nr:hypothetical protein [Chloroflexota bacterium]